MKNNNWKGESKKARNDTKWGKSTRHGERNTFQCLKADKQFEKSTKEAETKRKNKFCNLYEIHNITPLTRILSVRKTQPCYNLADCSTAEPVIVFQLDTFSCITCLGLLGRK